MARLNQFGSIVDTLDNGASNRTTNYFVFKGSGIKRIKQLKVGWTNSPVSATALKFGRVVVLAGDLSGLLDANTYIEGYSAAWPALMANNVRKILLDQIIYAPNGVHDVLLAGQFFDSEPEEPLTVIQLPAYANGDVVGTPVVTLATLTVWGDTLVQGQNTKEFKQLQELSFR